MSRCIFIALYNKEETINTRINKTNFFQKSIWICIGSILLIHFFYYPKWKKSYTEATISWDVSGYYMYLPAGLIYQDFKKCNFKDEILKKYQPTTDFQQAFKHRSGNYVMKYTMGQAIQFAPFFLVAHTFASNHKNYSANGFSPPYQLLISLSSLFYAIIGMIFLMKILLCYFDKVSSNLSMLAIVLGSNYLNYSAIDGAMPHNNLFTLYTILIYYTIKVYRGSFRKRNALIIGGLCGLIALTRPTDAICLMIPFLWGLKLFSISAIRKRWSLLNHHKAFILLAVLSFVVLISPQFIYWKLVGEEWLIYSYEDQIFSWLKPFFYKGFIGYRNGWLVYSPIMVFSLLGFYFLRRHHGNLLATCLIFFIVHSYVSFSWNMWWYGGSLGQRTMIQAYPILAFPMAAFIHWAMSQKYILKTLITGLFVIFISFNLWITHQAHLGKLFHSNEMNKEYFWSVLGKFTQYDKDLKLLDTDERYEHERRKVKLLTDLPKDSTVILDKQSLERFGEAFKIDSGFEWIRIKANFKVSPKEWNPWAMSNLVGEYRKDGVIVKKRSIKIDRYLKSDIKKEIYFDIAIPENIQCDSFFYYVTRGSAEKELLITGISIETYSEDLK